MKFDLKLLPLLIRDAALDVRHVRDAQLQPRQRHPRLPSVVARTAQRMVRVAARCPHLNAPPRQSLHRPQTHMRLLAAVLAQVLRHQPNQRTRRTAVRLLRRQLDLYDISLRHSYLSFLQYLLFLFPFMLSRGFLKPFEHSYQCVA